MEILFKFTFRFMYCICYWMEFREELIKLVQFCERQIYFDVIFLILTFIEFVI